MEKELIQVINDEIFTTSLIVAEKFGKNHRDVLRKIEDVSAHLEDSAILRIPHIFEKSTYTHEQNGQIYPMYLINRDGFTLLAMSFTGQKAFEWKLKYIQAFNEMEKRLRSQPQIDNRLEIARLIVSAPDKKVNAVMSLYPEYFAPPTDSLEYVVNLNTSYMKWLEDYNINQEWIGDYPTTDIYNNYVRYCMENRYNSMGKKIFYRRLSDDFNLIKRQRGDGKRYFLTA